MKLHLLGTAGYHPNERRHTACFFLPEAGIVLDAGTGLFRLRPHLATARLDVFITHAHLDHVVGLTYLLGVLYGRPEVRVTVHAAAPYLETVERHLFAEALFPAAPRFELRPLADSTPLAGGGRLTHFPLVHPGGSTGFRLDWPGRSLAYVTDTTARGDAPYVAAIRGVDLLLHECNFPDGYEAFAERTGHSCTSGVAEVARAARPGRLVLVHFDPLNDAADPVGLAAFGELAPRVLVGEDGMELEF